MLRKLFVLFVFIFPFYAFSQDNLKLWYKKPAKVWTDALPVGNGRLGAMVFGGVKHELIQLNEATLWSGGPVKTNVNPGAYANLQLAREALFKNEDYAKAYNYAKGMQGYYSESYLPLGDLTITQNFKDTVTSAYYRDLNIRDAITTTRFTIGGVTYIRQVIVSAPDQVIIIHLTANKIGQLNFKIGTASKLRHHPVVISGNEIALKGNAPSHVQPNYVESSDPITYDSTGCRGMRFELQVKAINRDGQVSADTSGISVKNATEVTIFLSAATSFNGFEKCPGTDGKDEHKLASSNMKRASVLPWSVLLLGHEADYHHFFNRVSFKLATPADNRNASLPTDERLVSYTKGTKDPELETLYFQYGRYLLISSSRTLGVPANLQGIWNKELQPPWSSNYTTNINVQMNYWPAEVANLSEMHMPFIDFIRNIAVTGKVTATEFYHAKGWAVHHNSDIWALSNPVGDKGNGDPTWANWTMGSPWLSQHLWWHYQFTKDKKYLREVAYPLMKGAAEFCEDWLVTDKDGYLVTAPSVSPENAFFDSNGKRASVSIATTMDMSIIRDLFNNVIDASNELGTDKAFRDSIIAKKAKLYPFQIGKKGNLQEWYKDFEDPEPHHRHVSHLFGLFPGHQISPVKTPELTAAAKKTLELRGDEGTGWSLAWKINFWARLLDGNHSYKMIKDLLRATNVEGTNYSGGGGSYINLFDAHPPFQIDGNFGGLTGMTEMLLQSQENEIYLLPALPDAWATGQISGLKARGNFEVGISWKNKKLFKASILSVVGGRCTIRSNEPIKVVTISAVAKKTANGYVISFESKKGVRYSITGTGK
ncbi:glycoside hydrolase family 95 protein [Mucilaginibacter sp. BJC16-A38]|uniref:glycoside hydrolase family 95 protein n=1 Tax=Mucilaginibacter phenanthrenivorans TaxID=1234842 RepID=UPI0021572DE7|nr:glycoside hydrolase family 95 protein [Mucilaginibacter phenanthrenivorans]MCR8559538.1 glycoside hydrolase family 95 protein [Mucilaginibacter phenanthrenivorans]